MNRYLSGIGKVSRALLLFLACFFLVSSLVGLILVSSEGLLKVTKPSQEESPTPIFKDLSDSSDSVHDFTNVDYFVLPDNAGEVSIIISRVVDVDVASRTISLRLNHKDATDLTDPHISDGKYNLLLGPEFQVLKYSMEEEFRKPVKFENIVVGSVVVYSAQDQTVYVKSGLVN